MATENKPSVLTRFTRVQAGIDKHITGNVTLGGVAYPPGGLKAVFAAAIMAINTADALRKQWTDAVLAAHQAQALAETLYELLRNFVISQFGKQANAVLGDFGMPVPTTPVPRTAEEKAASAAKSRATREMRGTMGKKQKKKVKGTIEVPNPELPGNATTTAPATPAAAPVNGATPTTNGASNGGTKPTG